MADDQKPGQQPGAGEGQKPGQQPGAGEGQKPGEGQPGAGGAPGQQPPADKKPAGAPEKYADFKMADGLSLDKATLDKFNGLAKGMNLTQEHAQQLVDLQGELVGAAAAAVQAEHAKTVDGWKQETMKVLGATHEADMALAAKAIGKYGTAELKTLLDETGMGNHPELARFFVAVGKTLKEDSFPGGKPSDGKTGKSRAEILYPEYK